MTHRALFRVTSETLTPLPNGDRFRSVKLLPQIGYPMPDGFTQLGARAAVIEISCPVAGALPLDSLVWLDFTPYQVA
jgi:hypothetical protein